VGGKKKARWRVQQGGGSKGNYVLNSGGRNKLKKQKTKEKNKEKTGVGGRVEKKDTKINKVSVKKKARVQRWGGQDRRGRVGVNWEYQR